DAFGARWSLGVAAIAGIVAFGIGIGWLIIERKLRLRVRGGRLQATHVGRDEFGRGGPDQEETLTAPIRVLRRGPVILSESTSAPQSGPLSEGITGSIVLPEDIDDDEDDPGQDRRTTRA